MVKRIPTTFGVDKGKLRRLLKMGLKGSKSKHRSQDHRKAQLWHELLSKPLPLDDPQRQMLPGVLSDFCQSVGLSEGAELKTHLRNPKTELPIIDRIKQYAKVLSCRSQSDAEHIVANTLYYAAIAHALLYHDAKITEFSFVELARAFDRLHKISWGHEYFVGLFAKARKYCRGKST